jgi:hypothetical protein
MDDPAAQWIEFTTQDGRTSRMRVDQIGMVTRVNGGDAGVIHTSLGELIRVLNVTHVLKQCDTGSSSSSLAASRTTTATSSEPSPMSTGPR